VKGELELNQSPTSLRSDTVRQDTMASPSTFVIKFSPYHGVNNYQVVKFEYRRQQMKKRITIIIISIIIFTCCISSGLYLFKRCFLWNCPPTRGFILKELELPKYVFPDYVILGKIGDSSENEGAIDSVGQNGYWGDGQSRIVYNVWLFGNTNQAKNFVREMIKNNEKDSTDLCKLEKDFESAYQKYTFHSEENTIVCGCGLTGGKFKVFYQASYEEYVISFMATLDGRFTIGDYFKVLEYIDNQMIEKLGHN
jgi:hypothetical protein